MVIRYQLLCILFFNLIYFSSELRDLRVIEENPTEGQTIIKPPGFSRISGFYQEEFKLKLSSEENTTIYYTLDSTDPKTSPTTQEFKDYILIYDRSSEPNIYSAFCEDEDSPVSISRFHGFKSPQYPVDKAMIVRAVAKNSKGEFSEVASKTYFVTTGDLYKYQDLTIISMVTDPENLFSPDKGIYVTGTMYQDWKKSDEYDPFIKPWDKNTKCNYFMKGSEWEREAFLTIFDKGEISLQQNIGIRIKGAATRNYPAKSFNVFARKKYGKVTLETNIIKDNYDINGNLITSYKGLTIRSVFDDTRIRDKIGGDLYDKRNNLTSVSIEPAILFINGEYWGFYLIQEKLNDDFIEKNYLIPRENVAIAKDNEIEDGPPEEITNFLEFCENYSQKDLSVKKYYEEIKNYIDIDSLIELYATGIYIENGDWPGKNDGEWRNIGDKIEGNKYNDGKWRFLIYDLDYSMGSPFFGSSSPDIDSFKYVEGRINRSPLNPFFLSFLKNNRDFQFKFVNIYCDYANYVFHPNTVNKVLEKYRDYYTELVANSQLRWSESDFKYKLEGYAYYKTLYLKAMDTISNFFEQRPKYTLQHMKDFIGLEGDLVDLIVNIEGKGKIQINSIIPDIVGGKWYGKYFTRIPIIIKAIPEPGYNFKGWSGYIQSIIQNEEIILFDNQTNIIAHFD